MHLNEIVTKEDIQEILKAIEHLEYLIITNKNEQLYFRSADVKKLLHISDGTLQRLRITKTLIGKKINGTWFYKKEDIDNMLKDIK